MKHVTKLKLGLEKESSKSLKRDCFQPKGEKKSDFFFLLCWMIYSHTIHTHARARRIRKEKYHRDFWALIFQLRNEQNIVIFILETEVRFN